MRLAISILLTLYALSQVPCKAGDAVGPTHVDDVPDWAIGPFYVLPADRVGEDLRLDAALSETTRIGSLQRRSFELRDKKHRIKKIELWEVPNDGYACTVTSESDSEGNAIELILSQRLFDQTYYFLYLRTIDKNGDTISKEPEYVVWDAKSRKKS